MPLSIYPTSFIIEPPDDLLTQYPHLKRNSSELVMKYAFNHLVTEDDLTLIGGHF